MTKVFNSNDLCEDTRTKPNTNTLCWLHHLGNLAYEFMFNLIMCAFEVDACHSHKNLWVPTISLKYDKKSIQVVKNQSIIVRAKTVFLIFKNITFLDPFVLEFCAWRQIWIYFHSSMKSRFLYLHRKNFTD